MERKDVAALLNNELLKNAIGTTATVEETLVGDGMIDYGKSISAATKSDFLDFYGQFVAGVIDYDFGLRTFEPTSLGIRKTVTDFIGVTERIKNRALLNATDSPVGNLQNGQNYADNKYHGGNWDNKIYTKFDTFRLIYSIEDSDAQLKQRFSDAEGVMGLVALIQNCFKTSLAAQRHEMEKRVLLGGMISAYKDSREIKLLTMYNTEKGTNLTVANCMTSADFQRYALNVISDVRNTITEGLSEIYNDGTVITFCPKDEIRTVMLGQFANACKFNLLATTYNEEFVRIGKYSELPFWQNRGTELVPRLGQTGCTIGEIKATDGASDDPEEYEIENVVACVYDNDALSYKEKILDPVIEPVFAGRFNNYIHDEEVELLVDSRSSLVIFTLN